MATYPFAYAQQHLADLLEQAGRGEEVVVANGDGVTVKFQVVHNEQAGSGRRGFGSHPELRAIPDSVWAPLTDEELVEWERPLA
jgi:hypothetical protein